MLTAHQVVEAILLVLYPLWGAIWLGVAYNYGRAARASWLMEDGHWGRVVRDIAHPFWHTLWNGSAPEPHYSAGHTLRWSIFLGSFTPIIWGFLFFSLDRSDFSWPRLLISLFGVLISLASAGGHLFLVYRANTRVWGWILRFSTLYTVVGIPVALVLWNI